MKKTTIAIIILLLLCGCSDRNADIAATTGPVYQFTGMLCEGTGLTVAQVVTEPVSCLHDYTLTVSQMKLIESAQVVVISGAGLEEFLEDILDEKSVIDASSQAQLLESSGHSHEEHGDHAHEHAHEHDPHIWLSPANAAAMARQIGAELTERYPQYRDIFAHNLEALLLQLDRLAQYGQAQLSGLSCRELITFHDGFAYLAHSYDLHILEAIEEESGSEASAKELMQLISLVRTHKLPAIFTEVNGSSSAADVICRETGIGSFSLSMAMTEDYFTAMYRNFDILKEALQ